VKTTEQTEGDDLVLDLECSSEDSQEKSEIEKETSPIRIEKASSKGVNITSSED
jgi:hypothetical protein